MPVELDDGFDDDDDDDVVAGRERHMHMFLRHRAESDLPLRIELHADLLAMKMS